MPIGASLGLPSLIVGWLSPTSSLAPNGRTCALESSTVLHASDTRSPFGRGGGRAARSGSSEQALPREPQACDRVDVHDLRGERHDHRGSERGGRREEDLVRRLHVTARVPIAERLSPEDTVEVVCVSRRRKKAPDALAPDACFRVDPLSGKRGSNPRPSAWEAESGLFPAVSWCCGSLGFRALAVSGASSGVRFVAGRWCASLAKPPSSRDSCPSSVRSTSGEPCLRTS